jgi:hypothetical protein
MNGSSGLSKKHFSDHNKKFQHSITGSSRTINTFCTTVVDLPFPRC